MIIKAKLRKIGNSLGILISKEVITYIEEESAVNEIKAGDVITLEVITDDKESNVITGTKPQPKDENAPQVLKNGKGKMVFNLKRGMYENV